ncbi:MAG: serine hydrolase domain-containing protein [Bacteroidota bacterium]
MRLLFLACFLFLLYSCSDNNASSKIPEAQPQNNDSINAILKEIRAVEKAKLLDQIFKNKVKTAGFNGCVLVAQRGQTIYKNAWGYADIKTKDPLKINSAFQLASVSKTLTASAILLLKDQGKLKLTDTLQKFFPDFPYLNITLKLLLSHRSGLFNYLYACEPFCEKPNLYNGVAFDNKAMLEIITKNKCELYAPANKKFEYSNTNYALLALVVEKVSGMNFSDFMEQHIFNPLGMNDSWVHDPKLDATRKNKTIGHTGSGKPEEECYADDVVGDKGIYSTVEDMLKWDQAFYSEKLLKKETIEEAFTGYSHEHKGKRNYGFGWRLIDNGKNDKIVYHNGWWHGFNTLFFRRPSDQTTVIILSNKSTRNIYHIEDILAVLNSTKPASLEGEE